MAKATDPKLTFIDQASIASVDWDQVAGLYSAVGWNRPFHKAPRLKRSFTHSYSFLLAYLDDRLVATGRTISDGQVHGSIHDVLVHPDYQRKGIGTALMSKLIEQLKGVRYVILLCSKDNEPFYAKSGFKGGGFTAMTMRQKTR